MDDSVRIAYPFRMMIRHITVAFAVAISSIASICAAQTPPAVVSPEVFVGGRTMPERELQLIQLFRTAAAQYQVARTAKARTDLRIGLELRVTKFMAESQEATDWLGVIRSTHSTLDGDRWLSVDITPDINLATYQNRYADSDASTLIHRYTPLAHAVDEVSIGDVVKFAGKMLILDVSDNDGMVLRPHFIIRFKTIEPAE